MSNKQLKKSYIKPELASLGSAVELTLKNPWKNYGHGHGHGYGYSYSSSSSYSQAGGHHHDIS